MALDLQSAGDPADYSLDVFRIAMLAHFPLWLLGSVNVIRLRKFAIPAERR